MRAFLTDLRVPWTQSYASLAFLWHYQQSPKSEVMSWLVWHSCFLALIFVIYILTRCHIATSSPTSLMSPTSTSAPSHHMMLDIITRCSWLPQKSSNKRSDLLIFSLFHINPFPFSFCCHPSGSLSLTQVQGRAVAITVCHLCLLSSFW